MTLILCAMAHNYKPALKSSSDILTNFINFLSRVMSDTSVSSDPQHFVNAILGCLARTKKTSSAEEDVTKEASKDGLRRAEMTPPESATEWSDEANAKPKHLVKPIKPFGEASTTNTPVVLPSRAQYSHQSLSMHSPTLPPLAEEVDLQSRLHQPSSPPCLTNNHPSLTKARHQHKEARPRHPESLPSSRTPTPPPDSTRNPTTPPLTKSSSPPASLHTSTSLTPGGGKRRKGGGAGHSSPIKSAALILPLPSPNTPDLSALANLNLSRVILDHVAMNQSTTTPPASVPAPQLSNLDKGELCVPRIQIL